MSRLFQFLLTRTLAVRGEAFLGELLWLRFTGMVFGMFLVSESQAKHKAKKRRGARGELIGIAARSANRI
uniref:Uncharacterized protein n=1 Tax=Anopheles darlingi TaxID=43151 RepID=A0A2M4D0J0_ANODA